MHHHIRSAHGLHRLPASMSQTPPQHAGSAWMRTHPQGLDVLKIQYGRVWMPVSSWTRPWGEDSGPFGCPQHPSVQASARVKAPRAQAQSKRPNQRFPQGQAGQRQKTPQNLPQSHAWRNRGRRDITALSLVSVQSPLFSRPINRSHPWTHHLRLRILRLPLRSHGLRRGPSSSSTATRKTWAGRRRRLDRPQSWHSDGRRRTR
jgi:hypothetical protein